MAEICHVSGTAETVFPLLHRPSIGSSSTATRDQSISSPWRLRKKSRAISDRYFTPYLPPH